jgi:hypothetical protein
MKKSALWFLTGPGRRGIKKAPVVSVVMLSLPDTIVVGNTYQATVVVSDTYGRVLTDRHVTWTSDTPSVATVDTAGLLTGVGAGITTVYATCEGITVSDAIEIVVDVDDVVASVTITGSSYVVEGDTVPLTATMRNVSGVVIAGKVATWASDTPGIVSIDPNTGVATGVAAGGPVTITATSDGTQGTFEISAIVAPTGDWQIPSGHYESHLSLHVIYPQLDAVTNTWARHRWAYPGIRYEIPIGVQFGAWPYKYEMIAGPAWLDIEAETLAWSGDHMVTPTGYGILAGIAPGTNQPAATVTVRVYDQDHDRPSPSYVDVTFTVTVDDSKFVFLDPVNGNDSTATGSISAPYKEVSALQDALPGPLTCYIRDTTAISGGYKPNPARQFRVGQNFPTQPKAYVGYPGETVAVNCESQSGFSTQSGGTRDTFFSNIRVNNANQLAKNTANVRVINRTGAPTRRECHFKLTNYNSYPGNQRNDNYGFIIIPDEGQAASGAGNEYNYIVDCVGDLMLDLGGSNGPALGQIMASYRNLMERLTVRNSACTNVSFVDYKHTQVLSESRACDLSENNTGTIQSSVRLGDNDGFSSHDCSVSYMKVPNTLMLGGSGTLNTGGAGTYNAYAFRNTCRIIGSAFQTSANTSNNACGSVAALHVSSGDVIVSFTTDIDASLNLSGAARTAYLGTKGAEVA